VSEWPQIKITVLKKTFDAELAQAYRHIEARRAPCNLFEVGQEFLVEGFANQPDDFPCGWAWNDIHRVVVALTVGGDFGVWMQNPAEFITCCTDGIKPVVFRVERLPE